jgi:hypothetical protein
MNVSFTFFLYRDHIFKLVNSSLPLSCLYYFLISYKLNLYWISHKDVKFSLTNVNYALRIKDFISI